MQLGGQIIAFESPIIKRLKELEAEAKERVAEAKRYQMKWKAMPAPERKGHYILTNVRTGETHGPVERSWLEAMIAEGVLTLER